VDIYWDKCRLFTMYNHRHHDAIFVSILYVTDDGFLVSVQYFVHVVHFAT